MPSLAVRSSASATAGTQRRTTIRRRLTMRLTGILRRTAPGRRLRIALALDALDSCPAQARVLDAGAEEGLLCLALARRHPAWTLVAADWSMPPLARGRRWARQRNARICFVQADLMRPLSTEQFDAVVALECLVEVPDDTAALHTLVSALRSGGLFVAQVPTADWEPVLPTAEKTWHREARHGYDADELRRWLESAGLSVHAISGTFHRIAALAQDIRDALRRRSPFVRMIAVPLCVAAVAVERVGIRIGRPRAWFVIAAKR
jgi:SAM-dependent methyltransferase